MLRRYGKVGIACLLLAFCMESFAATATFAISTTSTSNTISYATGSFTPASADLLVVFIEASGTVDAGAVTESLSQVTFSKVTSVVKASGADTLYAFVANGLLTTAGARTVTFACPGDSATGAIVTVYRISGMLRSGLSAIKQSSGQSNQAASATPTPVFGSSVLTGNVTLGIVGNATSPATMTPPSSWTEDSDNGYSTPSTGQESVHRDSGFAGTTVTWGGTSATAFGDLVLELDSSAAILTRRRAWVII